MYITLIQIILPVVFALLILPLFLRFIIGKILLFTVRKRFLKDFHTDSDDDKLAVAKLKVILLKKLSSPFVTEFNIRSELATIILTIQNCYLQEGNEELKFTFSVSDLIKCYFLLMSDINVLAKNTSWMNTIKRSRISTLKRVSRISGYYNYLYKKIPFLKLLRKGRITGKLIRILLIPILGLPSIIVSITASLISLFVTEIIWKYYYAVLLIKCAYYSMILYGHKASLIKEKLDLFPLDKIKEMGAKVEELIDPENVTFRSDLFEKSFIEYQSILDGIGISPEKDLDFEGIEYRFNKKRKVFRRVLDIPVNVVKQYNPFYEKSYSDRMQILEMVNRIGHIYSERENHYEDLRILEIFDVLYMGSILAYSKLLFGTRLLENISVDFLVKAKDFNDEILNEVLKNKVPGYRRIYKFFNLFRKSRVLYKAVRSVNPGGFLFSISGPIAFESVRIQMRDYVYHRAGRFTIYCYESNRLRRDRVFLVPDEL